MQISMNSWYTEVAFNDSQQQTSTNVTDPENKTMLIELPISDGASFGTSNKYAEKFANNGALKTDYLMGRIDFNKFRIFGKFKLLSI